PASYVVQARRPVAGRARRLCAPPRARPGSCGRPGLRVMTVRVVVVDDHQLLREAITELVNSEPGLEVVAAVGDARAAGGAVSRFVDDLLLLGQTLPGGGALGLVQRFQADGRPPTIIVSMHERPEY